MCSSDPVCGLHYENDFSFSSAGGSRSPNLSCASDPTTRSKLSRPVHQSVRPTHKRPHPQFPLTCGWSRIGSWVMRLMISVSFGPNHQRTELPSTQSAGIPGTLLFFANSCLRIQCTKYFGLCPYGQRVWEIQPLSPIHSMITRPSSATHSKPRPGLRRKLYSIFDHRYAN